MRSARRLTARRAAVVGLALTALAAATIGPVLATSQAKRYAYDGHPTDESAPSRTLTFLGDSVTSQAAGSITALGTQRGDIIDIVAVPGAAPCDEVPTWGAHLDAVHPQIVSIAYMGNATTPCMIKALGKPSAVLSSRQRAAIAAKYYVDLRALIRTDSARGITTVLVMPPAMARGTFLGQITPDLIVRLKQLAHNNHLVRLDTGARDLITPGGVFRATDTFGGVAHPLRYKDGEHLRLPYGTTLWALGVLSSTAQASGVGAPSEAPAPSDSPSASASPSPTDSPLAVPSP